MKTLRYLTAYAISALAFSSLACAKDGPEPTAPAAVSNPLPTVVSAPATITAAPTTAPAAVAAQPVPDEPIEIGYIEADIQNVLRTLSAKAGINLILGDEVTGKVTVNLKGVSYEQAMQLIAESKGYAYVKDKNIVKVKSKESLDTEAIEMRIYTLNYAKADDIKKTLDPVLTKQGRIQIDTRSNTLVLSDTPSSLAKLVPLIQALDTQTPQVMIEAKFVETTKNPKKDLGVDWTSTLLGHQVIVGGSALSASPGTPPVIPVNAQNQPIGGLQWVKGAGGSIVTPWSAGAALLDAGRASLVFSYLSQDTDTELLANPRVVTTDNVKARISIATQFPIPNFAFSEQTASLQINGFEYKDIGIILNVLPRINKDDFITLEVAPEASSSTENATLQSGGGSAVQIPIINTRTATTTVLIKSGNTLAIGGLMRTDVSDSYTKVPLMGDAPLFGPLFRSKSLSKTKRDLLIFLTPTIVRGDSQTTGYEKFANGLPRREVYTDDKWMPKDNAKARNLIGKPNSPAPDQNFSAQ
ncbi:MAG TPA: secretin N-terminal domain-containing protein [Verrucomicrobiae bacterium]|nr:secretin N-terminal domain-containing protein [Verrucomicrobiae bacterium]